MYSKVSIAIVTYNHESFIFQALDSVLMQQTNSNYEIVIGEDCSTDHTREIILDFSKSYPDKIRLLPRETNLGRPHNFIQTLQSCDGEYVAILEGDDYWTSPHKLQRQANYLDDHPECAICFHSVKKIYEDGSRKPKILSPKGKKKVYYLKDLFKGNFIPTNSVMFRNRLFDQFPDWYYSVSMGDWPLHVLNAQHGNIGYIDEIMSVYRIHGGGLWSSADRVQKSQQVIELYQTVNKHLDFRYDKLVRSEIYIQRCRIASAKGNRGEALKNLSMSVAASPCDPAPSLRRLFLALFELLLLEKYELVRSKY